MQPRKSGRPHKGWKSAARRVKESAMSDPMERAIRQALTSANVRFLEGDENSAHLDFYLPDFDLYIEVKQFHSERIGEQMSRVPNVIVAQGRGAVEFLARLLKAAAPRGNEAQVQQPSASGNARSQAA